MEQRMTRLITLFSLGVLTLFGQAGKSHDYVLIQPAEKTFVVPEVSEADVVFLIKSDKGQPVYKLQCHSAGFTGDPDFDYSGDFECRLSSVGHFDKYSTLLTEDPHQDRDWESRGRFFASELREPCAQIPHFGAKRDFRLRGMNLTLEIIDQQFGEDAKLKSLRLRVTARPDASSQRPIAEVVPYPKNIAGGCKANSTDQ
jgi:hypothetical protein